MDGDPFMDQLPSKLRVQVFQSYDVASLLQVSAVCGGHRHPLMEMQESPAEDAGVRDIHRIVSPMRATLEDVRFEGRNTYGNVQGQQRMYVVVTLHPLQAKESLAEDAMCPPHTSYRVTHPRPTEDVCGGYVASSAGERVACRGCNVSATYTVSRDTSFFNSYCIFCFR
jgi:hypothetical protein